MNVWVLGARGFIGRHAARHFSDLGWKVVGLGHGAWPETDAAEWGLVDWLNGDVSHANFDALAARHQTPDAVVHLAGGSSVGSSFAMPAEDFRRSVGATAELMEWVRRHAPSTRVVMASSAAVYGAGHRDPIVETAVCSPFSPYGFHKRIAELALESYARNFGSALAIVRLFSVYGPGLTKQLLWDSSSRLTQGQVVLALEGSGHEMRDWLHVRDAVSLLEVALGVASADCPIVNGGTGVATSVRDIAEHLRLCWGLEREVSFSGLTRAGDPQSLVADATLARKLGWSPSGEWKSGVAEYVSWFKEQFATVRK